MTSTLPDPDTARTDSSKSGSASSPATAHSHPQYGNNKMGTEWNIDTIHVGRDAYLGGTHNHFSAEEPRTVRARRRLLVRLRSIWIEKYLSESLFDDLLITLSLVEIPEATADPWRGLVNSPSKRLLPAGTSIIQVFDEASDGLLVLGEPGAGKTTLLLELARVLLDRAEQDYSYPAPAVLQLASWANNPTGIEIWCAAELDDKYGIPRALGEMLIGEDRLVLLLDGLDELPPDQRGACLAAINSYQHEHLLKPVVSCRREAYQALDAKMEFSRAIIAQPLTPQQISAYLHQGGESLAAARAILQADSDLMGVLDTPLILGVFTQAYHGMPLAQAQQIRIPLTRDQIFLAYIRSVFRRHPSGILYSPFDTQRWLTWLARQMLAHNDPVLYIEKLQPDWLEPNVRVFYRLATALISALMFGSLAGSGGYKFFGLPGAIIGGILVGGFIGFNIFRSDNRIAPTEEVTWSWEGVKLMRRLFPFSPVTIVSGGLVGGFFGWWLYGPLGGLMLALFMGTLGIPLIWLRNGLGAGVSINPLDDKERRKPNEGIWRSARYGVLGFVAGLVGMSFVFSVFFGVAGAILAPIMLGFIFGWLACIEHLILRLLFWRMGATPGNYVRFLDFATNRILLRKVGGGYIFIHGLLMEFFAAFPQQIPPGFDWMKDDIMNQGQ